MFIPFLSAIYATSSRQPEPYCVVKREGVELGRTQTLSTAHEIDWGRENLQPDLSPENFKKTSALIIEVWDKNVRGTQAGFLGQVRKKMHFP